MTTSEIPGTKASPLRYLSCLRPQDIIALQGSPLLGVAFALGRPGVEDLDAISTLLVANVLLIAHVFMLNDWAGLNADLADANKAANAFTARGVARTEMAGLSAIILLLSLLLFSRLGPVTFAIAASIALLSALYSLPRFDWKGRPLLNSLTHLAGGTLHFLLGYSVATAIDHRGIIIATFFALVFTAGHLTQEIRDHRGDASNGIRTNAVAFGPRRVFAASLILFALANIVLALLALQDFLPRPLIALVALFPLQLYWSRQSLRAGLTYASVTRLQTRYRALYAVIGLAIVAALFVS